MTNAQSSQGRSTQKILLIIIILLSAACLCLITLGLGGYLIYGDQIQTWFSREKPRQLEIKEGIDGSVSGTYQYDRIAGGDLVYFTVSPDGKASFHRDGDSEDQVLTVDLQDQNKAVLTWNGTTLNGMGALTPIEQDVFDDLMNSHLAHGLTEIPLDAACQGETILDERQMAALLFPLQMRFKYQITDRAYEARRLVEESACAQVLEGVVLSYESELILLSYSAPVPVVIGYFPFDAEGAVESGQSQFPGTKNACLPETWRVTEGDALPVADGIVHGQLKDQIGPCGALCRGACGADCDLDNCKFSMEGRCEVNEEGKNTGYTYRALIYDCGLHQGCINHDDCYDYCNLANGCNSWSAAICRHSWSAAPTVIEAGFCDQAAIWEEGPIDPALWAYGFGYMPERKTFVYLDKSWGDEGYTYNPDACPTDQEGAAPEPDGEKPEETEEKAEMEEKASPTQPGEIDPCDFLPSGGSIRRVSDYSCYGAYSDKTGERTVQIGTFSPTPENMDTICQSLEISDYTVVMKKLPLGECGYQVEQGYLGTPRGAPGYEGWGIQFGIEGFSVSVMTNENYPANETWIHLTAEEIEETIKAYLKK